ncbi:MAG: HPr family phosphocarrier protein [Lachnospiraceae bacterium]|nr:HPr family phosphocarrier protein [Lachnospiraceae bacterium]
MKQFNHKVTDPLGIHARPAGFLVKEAVKFACIITIKKDGISVDAKKVMAVMALGIKQNQEVTVQFDGEDESEAFAAILQLFKDNF